MEVVDLVPNHIIVYTYHKYNIQKYYNNEEVLLLPIEKTVGF